MSRLVGSSRVPEDDFSRSVGQVVAFRRALDLLAARPRVDEARLGLVGHDYGAMYRMLAAGAHRRTRKHVFVAATSSLNDWAFFARQPVSKTAYLRQNAVPSHLPPPLNIGGGASATALMMAMSFARIDGGQLSRTRGPARPRSSRRLGAS